MQYVREVAAIRDGFGDVFPPLPNGFSVAFEVGTYSCTDGEALVFEAQANSDWA